MFGNIARRCELSGGRRVELEGAFGRVSDDHHFIGLLSSVQIGVGRFGELLEHGEVSQHGQQTTQHDDGLATDFVGQGTKHDKERCADDQGCRHKQVGSGTVNLQGLGQEEQSIKLTGVPNHGLTRGETDQSQDDDLEVFPLAKRLGQRCFRGFPFGLHFHESRRLVHRQADVNRDGQQSDRDQERNAPSPIGKCLFTNRRARSQNHQQGQEQPKCCSGLNPSRVSTTLAMWRVFGHISGGTTILSTQSQALQQTQSNQDDGRSHTNAVVTRQNANNEGRQAHDEDGDQKGVFASDHVAQAAKENGTKGANNKPGGKGQQGKNEG